MMLEIDIDSDPEWDSSIGWDRLVRSAAEAAIAESAFPQLATLERAIAEWMSAQQGAAS